MLRTIDPLISPELLYVLARMGHGDDLAVVDTNFPAYATARHLVHREVLQIGCAMPEAVRRILTLFPLDDFVPAAAVTMQVVGDDRSIPPAVAELTPLISDAGHRLVAVERFEFYERARNAFAVLATQETRIYGNVILRKGVIAG